MNVKIYRPSRNAMQSGRGKLKSWVLEYETTSARYPEALMGWTASGDTLNQVRLEFDTQAEAIAFADKNGWEYTLQPSQERKVKPRNFGDNFRYRLAAEES